MNRRIIVITLLLLTGLLLAACASSQSRRFMESSAPMVVERPAAEESMPRAPQEVVKEVEVSAPASRPPSDAQTNIEQLQESRMIIYNANMFLVVEDTEQVAKRIAQMAVDMDGYVASMNGYRQGDNMVYDITIRLPAERFERGRTALREMAVRVVRENISTDDVTDQYYDIDARLQTLKSTEKELTQLLEDTRERGGDVDDIMRIYDRLIDIRSQIESLQGQLNRLDKLVALSTISIHLEPYILAQPLESEGWRPAEVIRTSVDKLLSALTAIATLLIQFVIIVLPILILFLLPLLLLIGLFHHWQKRRTATQTTDKSS